MKKTNGNRCLRLLMITLIAMMILAAAGVTAAAETLTNINLTIPEELLLAGATYTKSVYGQPGNVTVEGNACTVESIQWLGGVGDELPELSRLSKDKTYRVQMVLSPKAEDHFDSSVTASLNGNYDVEQNEKAALKLSLECELTPIVYGEITAVSLTGVPAAAPGNTAIPYSYTHTEGGKDQYTVTGTWYAYNASAQAYEPMASSDHFTENGSYQLALRLETKPGYIFQSDNVLVNDEIIQTYHSNDYECNANLYVSVGKEITEVEFTVPKPVEGQSFSAAVPITAATFSDHYTVKGNWRDTEDNREGTFTKGKEYYFESQIYANDGYCFAEQVEVYVNDDEFEWATGGGKIMSYSYYHSLRSPIHEVLLPNVPKAEVGKPIQINRFQLDVPAGAKYQATAVWTDESGTPFADETVKAGKKYILDISVEADNGYVFADSFILKINGIAHQGYGGYPGASYRMEYSFLKQISDVEVTGVIEPVVGQTPDTAALQPAEPEKYTIVDAVWHDQETGMPAAVFQNGHAYVLQATVTAQPGYEFAPSCSWKMGGAEGTGLVDTATSFNLFYNYSFEPIIPEIRINNIPSVKVGEPARTDVNVSAGVNYTAEAVWGVWNDRRGMFEPFSGIFEQGKTYQLSVYAFSNSGYQFAAGRTACYLDGVLHKNPDFGIDENGKLICIINFAGQDDKVIRKVELSIRKPLAGEHSSIDPLFTVPAGASVTPRMGWLLGNLQDWKPFGNRYFAQGGSYGVEFELIADEGYAFAEDLLIVVNGTVLPPEAYTVGNSKETYVNYFFGMTCQHAYENGQCIGCKEAEPTWSVPKTGDSSRLSLWFALLFLSGGAAIALRIADRRNRI